MLGGARTAGACSCSSGRNTWRKILPQTLLLWSGPQSPTPTPRPAHQILLPAVYDRIALAVNLKSKHMGRREVPGAGEEGQASGKFQTFLLVPRCKNLGHVYFNVSSKASSFLPRDGELNDSSASTPYPPVLETHIWDPPTTQR